MRTHMGRIDQLDPVQQRELQAELAQLRAFVRFLLDDAKEPADLDGMAARIRNDAPRLLRRDKDVRIG